LSLSMAIATAISQPKAMSLMTWVGSIGYYFHYMSIFQHLLKA
jgi:hypothetical protein